MNVWYDYLEPDKTVNRLIPREDFAHTKIGKPSSNIEFEVETTEADLAKWILDMRSKGLRGRVRLKSTTGSRNALYSIANCEVA